MRWLVAGGACARLTLGCDEYEPPVPPDVSALVALYEQPTGILNRDSAPSVLGEVLTQWREARNQAPTELAHDLVGDLARVEDAEPDDDAADAGTAPPASEPAGEPRILGRRINVAAHATLQHVCPGWGADAAIDRELSGWAELIARVDEHGVIPIAWGRLHHCRFERRGVSAELEGDVQLVFGDGQTRLSFKRLRDEGYLFHFKGTAALQLGERRQETDTEFSFRVFREGELQWSVLLVDATNIVAVFDPLDLVRDLREPTLSVGVNTRDDRWRCAVSITNKQGTCASQVDPTRMVTW